MSLTQEPIGDEERFAETTIDRRGTPARPEWRPVCHLCEYKGPWKRHGYSAAALLREHCHGKKHDERVRKARG